MVYLDYFANTPVDEAVLERFCAVERSCPGNANSRHQAGAAAKTAIDEATQSIARSLNVQPAEIIYTSGASEANSRAHSPLSSGAELRSVKMTCRSCRSIWACSTTTRPKQAAKSGSAINCGHSWETSGVTVVLLFYQITAQTAAPRKRAWQQVVLELTAYRSPP